MKLAAQAAFRAGEIIRTGYDQLHEVEAKGIGDLVSDIDRKADAEALQILVNDERSRPILSEELSPEISDDVNDFWIVDPLDGTSAFLFKTGTHFSSVIIALREQNETELGLVYFPCTGEWFYAQKGQGAFVNGQPLRSDQKSTLAGGWVELNQYSDCRYETDSFRKLRDKLRTADGAALVTQNAPYSGVAQRIADPKTLLVAAIHDNHSKNVKQAPWDIAGPQRILEEAGGVCLNLNGDRVDPFVAETFCVAANQQVGDSILSLLD